MKHLLLTTIAAVVLVGCGESRPLSEADKALIQAARKGDIETVKQHLDAGADVNAKSYDEWTPLHFAALSFLNPLHDQKGIVELKSPNRNFCKGASLVNCRIFGPPFVVVNQVKIVNSEEMENRRV